MPLSAVRREQALLQQSSNSLAPLGRVPPSRGRSFLVPVSDTLPLNPNEDCAPVPFWPAPIFACCQLCRLLVVAFRRRSWSRDGSRLPSGPRAQQLDDASYSKARHPSHLPLISRLWPESTKQLVPCRLAGAPVAACGTLLGTLKLNSPVSWGTTLSADAAV